MDHTLIYTMISSIVMAFIFGSVAVRLRLPSIVGYLLAGILIGPNTPGFVASTELAQQLAEIGIMLLMFGVGLHFSFRDLLEVRKIALPGAVAQMLFATLIGMGVAVLLGYDWGEGLIFGFSLSVASTIVLLRALEQHKMLSSPGGKLAIGWLIVEDLMMVLALVMLPVVTQLLKGESMGAMDVAETILLVVLKIGAFFVLMMVVGRRFVPWMLDRIDGMHQRELMSLATLAIALGFAAVAYVVFHASFALGAFLAGMVLNESEVGRKAAKASQPMRDAFSVLFFVSVGMLFEPMTLVNQPGGVLATVAIVVLAKSFVAQVILWLFRQPRGSRVPVVVGLAQIGEFSFILGALALTSGLIDQSMYNLILAGAMISILVNPMLFHLGTLRERLQKS